MADLRGPMMCPHCGARFTYAQMLPGNLVPVHGSPGPHPSFGHCPGSKQHPRNAESDRRPLWKDE